MQSHVKVLFQKNIVFCLLFSLLTIPLIAQNRIEVERTSKIKSCPTIYFRVNESVIDKNYASNEQEIAAARKLFNTLFSDERISIDSILIHTTASPDGIFSKNKALATARGREIVKLIQNVIPPNCEHLIHAQVTVSLWEDLDEIIQNDSILSKNQKEDILIVINGQGSHNEKQNQLRKLHRGVTYKYLAKHILPKFRSSDLCTEIIYTEPKPVQQPEVNKTTEISTPPIFEHTEEPILEQPLEAITPPAIISPLIVPPVLEAKKRELAIKINALYLAGGVTNVGVEYPISDKLSIDLPFIFSPYKISNSYRIKVLAIQPELRYWLGKPLLGSFVGLHGHVGYFNVSFNNKKRYQDVDGDTPLWGFGVSYGHSFALSSKWSLELTAGAGYVNIKYDIFRNYHNGPKYDSGSQNYWGITRAGVNIIYKINLNK